METEAETSAKATRSYNVCPEPCLYFGYVWVLEQAANSPIANALEELSAYCSYWWSAKPPTPLRPEGGRPRGVFFFLLFVSGGGWGGVGAESAKGNSSVYSKPSQCFTRGRLKHSELRS